LQALYSFKDTNLSFDDFTAELDSEYAELLADGQIQIGFTSILETVPPVPDACDQEVIDA